MISNVGTGEAQASKTGLTQPSGSSEILIDTPPIAVGQSVTVTAECIYGSVAQATIRADATGEVDEIVELNMRGIEPGDSIPVPHVRRSV